jgi:26S proteasome regulatory subunit N10
MVLEACMICLDNSEFMRNGDYVPSRFEAQHDAVNLITGAKTQQHPENCVGVIAMASETTSAEVLVNLTADFGQILTSVHKAKIGGDINFSASINIARLALKHRQNRNQRQRIVVFVGSPLQEDSKQLTALGKTLKKNNVSVDVINFGQEAENTEKLDAFVTTVDRDGTSHLVTVPPGPHILSDILVASAIVRDGSGEDGARAGGAGGFDFGVNPELDPELAMVLQMSREEHERSQQQQQQQQQQTQGAGGDGMNTDELDEETRLAIEMSLSEFNAQASASTPESNTPQPMSIDTNTTSSSGSAGQTDPRMNPDFLRNVLTTLPGVDTNDPLIMNLLNPAGEQKKPEEEQKKKEDDEGH